MSGPVTLLILIAGGRKEPHICGRRPSHRRKNGKRNKPHLYQVEVGGQRGPGARPLVRDVGSSLGHSPCLPLSQRQGPRLGISPAGSTSYEGEEGHRQKEQQTQTTNTPIPPQTTSSYNPDANLPPQSWESVPRLPLPFLPASPQGPNSRALWVGMAYFQERSWSQGPTFLRLEELGRATLCAHPTPSFLTPRVWPRKLTGLLSARLDLVHLLTH